MKKIIFQMSVSLDGYIEGPNHEIDWHLVDDEFNAYALEMLIPVGGSELAASFLDQGLLDELHIILSS